MFNGPRYTEAEMMARLKFTVGLSLAFTLIGIVFVVLYSLIFVTQPMTQSPNDAKFFELITPIATFLTGILSGIMLGKDSKAEEPPKAPELPPIPTPDPDPVHAEVAPLQTAAADDHHDDHIA
jgi:Na+-transporting methylmalonyl-CoA/oxaloacetate decarboxylase gamma subunit